MKDAAGGGLPHDVARCVTEQTWVRDCSAGRLRSSIDVRFGDGARDGAWGLLQHVLEHSIEMAGTDPHGAGQILRGQFSPGLLKRLAGALNQEPAPIRQAQTIGLAPLTGTKAGAPRCIQRVVKTDMSRSRVARRTGRAAIDAGRDDRAPEGAVRAFVSRTPLGQPSVEERCRRRPGCRAGRRRKLGRGGAIVHNHSTFRHPPES